MICIFTTHLIKQFRKHGRVFDGEERFLDLWCHVFVALAADVGSAPGLVVPSPRPMMGMAHSGISFIRLGNTRDS